VSAAAPPGYRALRALARLLLAVFYRRLEVVGLERVPPAAPLVVAANHTNALIDPMLLLAALPRRLTPVAKAPLFRHPVLAPFLALAGAIPVERRQDEGSDPAKNEAALAALAAALARGAAVLVFPEGVSQPEPRLMPLRTGAARMLLAAEAGTRVGVTLLPVGLVFDAPGTFRGGRALVLIGSPVPTDDCVAERARDPRAAARRLTDRLAAALRRQTVEAEDRETLRLIQLTERVWRHTAGGDGTGYFYAYDARTGQELWRFQTGAGVNAAPMSFEVDGEQFIAVAAGGNFQLRFPYGNSVYVFGLPRK